MSKNKELIEDFMSGYCDVLALEFNRRLGLSILVGVNKQKNYFQHACIKVGEDKYIDACCIDKPKELTKIVDDTNELFKSKLNYLEKEDALTTLLKYRRDGELGGDFVPKYSDLSNFQKLFVEKAINYWSNKLQIPDNNSPVFSSGFNLQGYMDFNVGMRIGKKYLKNQELHKRYDNIIQKYHSYYSENFRRNSYVKELYYIYICVNKKLQIYYVITPIETYYVSLPCKIWHTNSSLETETLTEFIKRHETMLNNNNNNRMLKRYETFSNHLDLRK